MKRHWRMSLGSEQTLFTSGADPGKRTDTGFFGLSTYLLISQGEIIRHMWVAGTCEWVQKLTVGPWRRFAFYLVLL